MKKNYAKIHEDLQLFSVPVYDCDEFQKTIQAAEKVYCENLMSKRIGFREFISMQVRFISRWVWLAQAAFLLLFILLLSQYHFEKNDIQPIFLLFSFVAPLIAFIGFPEILKSYSHNMDEIEICTRFSICKLMSVRMLIIGLADLCCLTVILTASAISNGTLILRMILYLFVPFNLTCSGCLSVLNHVRSKYSEYYCAAVCLICIAVFCKLSFLKAFYVTATTGIWMIMFLITIVYFVIELVQALKNFNCLCTKNEEVLSVSW